MSDNKHPISEQFRIVAKQWVEANAAATMLEECKTATLEQRKVNLLNEQGQMADNAAERIVKASPEWHQYLKAMCDAREKANRYKIQLEFIRMQHQEMLEGYRNRRTEMHFHKSGVDT